MKTLDVIAEIVRVLKIEGSAILKSVESLQDPYFRDQTLKAIEYMTLSLAQGGKIVVTGVGKSGKVGQKIASTLCSTGSLSVFLDPTDGIHGDLGVIQSQDTVLALSYTGNTEELIQLMPPLKRLGVPVVGVGGNSKSKLASFCEAWIDARVESEACPHNLAPTTSTTLALAWGDAIAVTLMQLRGFDSQSFAKNHPGGSLGRRMNLRVIDLMHTGGSVPSVGAEAGIDEVLVLSSQKKMGAVLVVQEGHLLGIITDGDIRRSLQHRERFFQLKANQVMTAHPITASSEMMAEAALRLMEDRPSQISVLPVVDLGGKVQGLIRLHDLVQAF